MDDVQSGFVPGGPRLDDGRPPKAQRRRKATKRRTHGPANAGDWRGQPDIDSIDLRARADWDAALLARLQQVTAGRTPREVSRLLHANHESTRRYLRGARPSSRFIAVFCTTFHVRADWLLNGLGPMRTRASPRGATPGPPPVAGILRAGEPHLLNGDGAAIQAEPKPDRSRTSKCPGRTVSPGS